MRRAVRLRKASQSRDGEEGQEKKSPRKNAGRRKSSPQPQDSEISMNSLLDEIPSRMPVLPLRDNVVFNSMIVPLYEGREKAILGVDAALSEKRYMLLCTQKDPMVEDPGETDLHPVGTVVVILRMLRMPDGQVKILVQGLTRARLEGIISNAPVLTGRVSILEEEASSVPEIQREAMIRSAREQSEKILHLRGIPTGDIMGVLMAVDDPGRLADLIAANMRLKVRDALMLLDCLDPVRRLQLVNEHLAREVEVASMQAHIQSVAKEGMDKAQKDYFLREQIKAIQTELGDKDATDVEDLRERLAKTPMNDEARDKANRELERLSRMAPGSPEIGVSRTYIEWLLDLPWGKTTPDNLDLKRARRILAEDHYGLDEVKQRVIEYLAVCRIKNNMKGPVLCFVGPPGVGKTSIAKSIAEAHHGTIRASVQENRITFTAELK